MNTDPALSTEREKEFQSDWRSLHRIQRRFISSLIGGPVFFGLVGWVLLSIPSGRDVIDIAMPVLGTATLLAWMFFGLSWTFWRCPRCQAFVFMQWYQSGLFSPTCPRCGLREGTRDLETHGESGTDS